MQQKKPLVLIHRVLILIKLCEFDRVNIFDKESPFHVQFVLCNTIIFKFVLYMDVVKPAVHVHIDTQTIPDGDKILQVATNSVM